MTNHRTIFVSILLSGMASFAFAQYPGWQQQANYTIDIVVDTSNHQYNGSMKVVYTNNSPETLERVFWHLFFNAFQPGSMMDVRSQTISDPDRRVGNRIGELPEDEWGWQKIESSSKSTAQTHCLERTERFWSWISPNFSPLAAR